MEFRCVLRCDAPPEGGDGLAYSWVLVDFDEVLIPKYQDRLVGRVREVCADDEGDLSKSHALKWLFASSCVRFPPKPVSSNSPCRKASPHVGSHPGHLDILDGLMA